MNADRRSLTRLLGYVRPYRLRLFQATLVMIIVAALNGALVKVLGPITNSLFVDTDAEQLKRVALLIPVVFFLKLIFQYTQSYLMSWFGQKITQEIREDLFTHLHALSMDFFWKSKGGEVLAKLTNDMNNLQSKRNSACVSSVGLNRPTAYKWLSDETARGIRPRPSSCKDSYSRTSVQGASGVAFQYNFSL